MTKATSPLIGIDFSSAGGNNDGFAPNTEVSTDDGVFVRCIAGTQITARDCVKIDASGTANPITAALAAQAGRVAISPVAAATASSFWAQRTGVFAGVRTLTGCLPNVPLYTTDTAGVLDDATASTSHYQVMSLALTATNSGATASALPAAAGGYLTIRRPQA